MHKVLDNGVLRDASAEEEVEIEARQTEAQAAPAQVTNRQAKLALLSAGKLAAVDAAIAAMPNPQKEAAQIEWTYAGTFDRTSPLVLTLGPALGLDDAALDELFIMAATL